MQLFHPTKGVVICVNEKVPLRLKEINTSFQKTNMFIRDQIHASSVSIGIKRSDPASLHPTSELGFAVLGTKHHFVVITEDWHKTASCGQINQLIEYTFGVDASVNVVAQGHDGIVRLWINAVDQSSQGSRAAVNITNGDCSISHFSAPIKVVFLVDFRSALCGC
jgi:hypothetical protein